LTENGGTARCYTIQTEGRFNFGARFLKIQDMDKQTFIDHFKLLLVHLHEQTSQDCFNKLSENHRFIIEPSARTMSNHLTEAENGYLSTFNKLRDKELSFDQVVNLLFQNNKTPKWIDSSVYYATTKRTVVHLFFSRQFRDGQDIYYLEKGTGPFKAVVCMPPDNRKIMKDGKFDVNWKKYRDDKRKRKEIMNKILRFLTGQ